jgi:hypothetical protein
LAAITRFENKRNSHPAKRKSSGPCCNVAGGFLAGYIGSFWSAMDKPEFFLLVAGIAAAAGAMILGCRWVVGRSEIQV